MSDKFVVPNACQLVDVIVLTLLRLLAASMDGSVMPPSNVLLIASGMSRAMTDDLELMYTSQSRHHF